MDTKRFLRGALGGIGGAVVLTCAIAVPAFAEAGVTTMVTSTALNMRSGASLSSSVEDVIPEGTSVQVFSMTAGGWYSVEYNGQRGYSWFKYLDFEGSTDGATNDGKLTEMYATTALNVRAQPSTSAEVIGSLSEGEAIPVTSKHNGWFTVTYNGQEAYCWGGYLGFGQTDETTGVQSSSDNTMNDLTATCALNVRAEPNANSTVIGSFAQGEKVHVIGVDGDWDEVDYGGATGWCYSKYLQ